MKTAELLVVLAVVTLVGDGASADPVADFYSGKQIKIVVRSEPGTTYEQYSRLLAKHMPRHIPGNPQMQIVFMPGGGGIKAANYVANNAAQDGTTLTIVGQGLPSDQALGLSPSFQADLRTFNWIGNVSSSNQVLVTWHTSKTQNLDDAILRETVIGSTGAGSQSQQFPSFFNNILGTKLKLVFGYPSPNAINLAMENGEVEGAGSNIWARYLIETPRYVSEKLIVPILQVGLTKEPDLPDVPLLRDLAKSPRDHALMDFMSASVSVGRPLATTPNVPPERVAALRSAFDATLRDPDFLKDAELQRADVRSMTGAQLEEIVRSVIETPPDIRDLAKAAIRP
jgi:tripartite-type tricarboxylate transporter receptor subunit TctC